MQAYYYPAIVTLLIALVYFWMALTVARTHARTSILPPTMTGDPVLERTYRATSIRLSGCRSRCHPCGSLLSTGVPAVAALLGLLWIAGRVIYFVGYVKEAKKRLPGFFIQATAAFAMLLGALGRIIYLMATNTTP